jgi:ABC-2 type transport system permease protein
MAVYERIYRRYAGELTPTRTRFLVIPRYAFREVFKSRWFLVFFVLCFVPPLIFAAGFYLRHNLPFLELFNLQAGDFLKVDGRLFYQMLVGQGLLSFLVTVFVAPALVSSDLRNNALPLYLSRPFTRFEYVLGKATVLAVLISAVTWIPLLLLFILQASLESGWFAQYAWIVLSILAGSALWILLLCLLGLSVSAWVKWKAVARLALFAIFFVSGTMAGLFNLIFRFQMDKPWGDLMSVFQVMRSVWLGLFQEGARSSVPVWSAWFALVFILAATAWLLSRKVRAYEVVK